MLGNRASSPRCLTTTTGINHRHPITTGISVFNVIIFPTVHIKGAQITRVITLRYRRPINIAQGWVLSQQSSRKRKASSA